MPDRQFPELIDYNGDDKLDLISLYSHVAGCTVTGWDHNGIPDLLVGGDERRMIEVKPPAHLAIFYGEETDHPPAGSPKHHP